MDCSAPRRVLVAKKERECAWIAASSFYREESRKEAGLTDGRTFRSV